MASVNFLDTDIYYGQAFDQYIAGTTGNITVSNKMSDDIFVRVSYDGYSTQSFIVVSKNQSKSFARTKIETIWVSGIKGGPVTTYLGIPGVALLINNPTDGP